MIGAEVQRRAWPGERREGVEQTRLHHTVFPVTAFRPRIGKQHKHPPEAGSGRKSGERGEEQRGFGLHEGEIAQLRAHRLALGPGDAVGQEVEPHAKLVRMRRGVGIQVVAVTAAQFERERRACGQARKKVLAQGGEALVANGVVEIERHRGKVLNEQ